MIVSHHQDAGRLASFYKIPLHYFPTTSLNKIELETREIDLLERINIDLTVLAR